VLDQLSSYVNDLAAVELRARAKVLADYPYRAMDSVSRAYGLLRYCWLIDEDDAVEALLTLRFGVEMGLFGELTHKMIEQALTYSLSAHLQGVLRGNLHIEDLKRARALMVRKHLKCSH
jgi:protein arginine kinase